MSFGMILDRSINLYMRNFWLLFGIMAIPQLINHLTQAAMVQVMGGEYVSAAPLSVPVAFVVQMLTMTIGTGAVTIAISNRFLGREITILQSYRITFRRIWILLAARLLAGLAIGWSAFPTLVPAILLSVAFSLITPVIMLEDRNVGSSLTRSRNLTLGFGWQILALWLIYFTVYGVVSGLLGGLMGALLERTMIDPTARMLLAPIILAPLLILLSPVPALFTVLIYYNQRIKTEGFDLTLLAEALSGQ
jgi:hypothetical protein